MGKDSLNQFTQQCLLPISHLDKMQTQCVHAYHTISEEHIQIGCRYLSFYNRPVTHIPQWTHPISHNAPFCYRNMHMYAYFCHKMVHYWMFVNGIMGFFKWVYLWTLGKISYESFFAIIYIICISISVCTYFLYGNRSFWIGLKWDLLFDIGPNTKALFLQIHH